ncbi:UPF0149 family protein [Methyloversatilis sp.]|uniref:UPF0149 family protein n=1 Tax=Methyloversatilis sp. TaxID=2569862 RepID=UPI003F706712
MDVLSQPLSKPELDTLEDFLASPQFEYRAMELPMLEGFLTALVIGPRMVMPGEWLPRVWDRYDAAVAPAFADAGQAERITTLLMRFMNGIADTFLNDPGAFQPIFWQPERRGAPEWCEGFLAGTAFCDAEWAALWDEEPALFSPLMRLGTDEGRAMIREDGETEVWMKLVQPMLVAIHEIWLQARTLPLDGGHESAFEDDDAPAEPFARPEPKVGRNDACPCGSGKKFEKCCGGGDRSVH